ncbi:TPA: hypothetical protein N0F65_009391 [Lagenidium giganteum]|uniref:MAPEG family protein n=1 Tax=Lagenidium giganteum TaxID=4803 RepID=A0AAV2ZDG6_9STRA|nr:TPA: hypothetical protein N0F65_009391 [Lagenidium giganteum]
MANSEIAVMLQRDHGFVLIVVLLTVFVDQWAGIKVGKARKTYDVHYPQMYAERSDRNFMAFNCVQRAHQNFLENMSFFFTLLMTSSIFRPGLAAIAGFIRLLAFIVYIVSYASGDPNKRFRSAFGYVGFFGAIALTIEAIVKLFSIA